MSHFTVAVITDSIEKLESMLAPYDENIEVAPYIDETKEDFIKAARERKEQALKIKKEGKKLSKYDLDYLNANTDEELYKIRKDLYEDEIFDEQRKSSNNL